MQDIGTGNDPQIGEVFTAPNRTARPITDRMPWLDYACAFVTVSRGSRWL